jgi:hypothetical protein
LDFWFENKTSGNPERHLLQNFVRNGEKFLLVTRQIGRQKLGEAALPVNPESVDLGTML